MTDSVDTLPVIALDMPLPGLENMSHCHIRPLAVMTLFSVMNRLLRPEFPIQRNYDLTLHVLNKGLFQPAFSRNTLLGLPLKTIDTLMQQILLLSATHHLGTILMPGYVNPLDTLLSLIIALEDVSQFELATLVSEDLALLESHQQAHLQGHYFKSNNSAEAFSQLLDMEGYRDDLMLASELENNIPPALAYWLSRRLSIVLPWSMLLEFTTPEALQTFPYLHRLKQIKNWLQSEKMTHQLALNGVGVLQTLPTVSTWIQEVFPAMSETAGIPRPVQALVLVEGATEEVLIPVIAAVLGHNLNREGIHILPVGGKNQMLQQYVHYAEYLTVPICIVLDQDAQSLVPDLAYYQRDQDHFFILQEGEFEDTYTLELIVKAVNEVYAPAQPIQLESLRHLEKQKRVKTLQRLWQELGLGLFDKVDFAQQLKPMLAADKTLVSPAMAQLIDNLMRAKTHAKPALSR